MKGRISIHVFQVHRIKLLVKISRHEVGTIAPKSTMKIMCCTINHTGHLLFDTCVRWKKSGRHDCWGVDAKVYDITMPLWTQQHLLWNYAIDIMKQQTTTSPTLRYCPLCLDKQWFINKIVPQAGPTILTIALLTHLWLWWWHYKGDMLHTFI